MCGILVVFSKRSPIDRASCERALASMAWRGPDFSYSHVHDDRLFLGQTILSITGNPGGRVGLYQTSKKGRYELMFNGEIYNFRDLEERFLKKACLPVSTTGTDTEVLASLHDVLTPADVYLQLDGMYAYVLFDREARRLHLARDVQGEKSLYYYEDSHKLVIASEIRAIQIVVPDIELDIQPLRDYFRTRHFMLFDRTVYRGAHQILPGRLLTYDLDGEKFVDEHVSSLSEWINPQRLAGNAKRTTDSLADELDHLLTQCVREMIPKDRRYAAVVSGGIDSSLLAHYLVKNGNPDLLVGVNHLGKDKISQDLSGFERVLGRKIEVLPVDAAAYAAEIPRCQQVCSGPLYSHSFIGQSVQAGFVRGSGCRILFGGDGADEFFGGYNAYAEVNKLNGQFSPSPYMTHQRPVAEFDRDEPRQLQEELAAAWGKSLEVYRFIEDRRMRLSLAMMYCDAAWQLPAVGLRGADLMSMMWSVETRSVFLRRSLVEFALNLPVPMKADWSVATTPLLRAKPLLKRLFLRHYPASLLAEKQGFSGFPNEAGAWLGETSGYLAIKHLGINRESLQKVWLDRASAWKLINVEYFLRLRFGRL